jgi:hypothetical protein
VTAERRLVTGAPGCIGPWIVRSSAKAGHDAASQVPSRHGPGLTPDVAGVSVGSGEGDGPAGDVTRGD